jgi:glycosyltransferase involved in cell wall biosynthesis
VIAATTGIQKEIRRFYNVSSTVIPEVGIPPLSVKQPAKRAEGAPLQLVWSGNHLPGKALPLLLRALSRVGSSVNWRLTVLGSGPCTREWCRLSEKLGFGSRVRWTGQLGRREALTVMQRAQILIITSVYDLTSTVLVEALANGLPVICPDHCGFRDAIDESCGIRVPAGTVLQLIDGLAEAIISLSDEDARYTIAMGAVQRSQSYRWEHKASYLDVIYRKKASEKLTALE